MKKLIQILLFAASIILINNCQSPTELDNTTTQQYQEQHRPQFHFTPPTQWMNDPNGMVYYEGEYHLFYQHYPDSNVWGPMHWGHAVSKDLVSWEHLPIALYPDSIGYIFSGSAVVDKGNTSNLGENGKDPLIAIFTYHDPVGEREGSLTFQTQGIAYSNDNGRSWTKYEGNPVIPNPGIRDFRDPKVFWHEDSQQWVMIFAARDRVRLYNSPNLKDWTFTSEFGADKGTHAGVWECPDLFKLPIEGSSESRWVMLLSINPGGPSGGSATQYFVGDFDGKTFTLDPEFETALGRAEAVVPDGQVFEDFENGYQSWNVEGNAFGGTPAKGTLSNQNMVSGFEGERLANSFLGGDAATGKLSSPEFTIEKPFINLLVGGGTNAKEVAVKLMLEGKAERIATGENAEKLQWTSWDVRDLQGKQATIEIIDEATGGWGHINVDQITFADAPAKRGYEKAVWLDYGRDNYAGVTWSNIPTTDGRRLFIGWMSNWDYANIVPTYAWRSAMTVSRTLTLHKTPQGPRVFSKPVEELKNNRGEVLSSEMDKLENESRSLIPSEKGFTASMMEFELIINLPENSKANFGLEWSNNQGESYRLGYEAASRQFYSDRTQAGKKGFSELFASTRHYGPNVIDGNRIVMHGFIDVSSAELFANDGATVITDLFFPNEDFSKVQLFAENGGIEVEKLVLYEMKSIW